MLIDRFAKLDTTSRTAALGATLLIVAVAVYGWIVGPHVAYLKAVQRYGPVVDEIAKEERVLRESVTHRQDILKRLDGQFSQMQSSLFTVEQARQFFTDLEPVAAEHGCVLTALDPDTGSGRTEGEAQFVSVRTADTSLSVVGGFDGILAFLRDFQAPPHKLWVRSICLEVLGVDGDKLKCDLVMTMLLMQEKEKNSHE